ncbi:hypothetical protein [Comamonas jiangduensis]|uniref:hypothetical protein n=1 Tax=Comamonas jiangduensis TaxID=1194168 RepID=UPI0024E13D51|nr:hypothetical protein [Comamonas jiangduensis]
MADSTGRKQRKRIEYLEALALKQAALLKSVRAACKVPGDLARSINEATAAAGMIQEAQAARAASKTHGEPKP